LSAEPTIPPSEVAMQFHPQKPSEKLWDKKGSKFQNKGKEKL
jgi:hypothetical protein